MQALKNWFDKYFSDPQVIFLVVFLVMVLLVIQTMGDTLTPVLASLVIAYLLEGLVTKLRLFGLPHLASVIVIFLLFMLFVSMVLLGVLPLLSRQATELANQLPSMINQGQQALMQLPERYPDILTPEQVQSIIESVRSEIAAYGQKVVSVSMSSVVGIITLTVYTILVPLLVFFFMKDRALIIGWFSSILPAHRQFAGQVWKDVDRQLANYVRGKFWEILVVGLTSYLAFTWFGLNYAMLLGVLVGLSVIIPYIGAAVVTFPVLLIGWFQWGWGSEFMWMSIAYFVIQALDGNVLVPLLFSEVVNLHPVSIIVAILVFGGLWGFWGVFFAIPLATLVQAVIVAWPRGGPNPDPGAADA